MAIFSRDYECTGLGEYEYGEGGIFTPTGGSLGRIVDLSDGKIQVDITGEQPVVGQVYTLQLVPKEHRP